jgi:RNA polymerase sigma-70 factor (ECF subfamily)
LPLRLFNSEKQKKKELQQLTDELLVTRYARTYDPECLGVLYERYTHLVFSVSMKYLGNDTEAEDMVMLVFEKLFEELKHAEVKTFKSWLYTVTRNQCLMHLRHHRTVERSQQEILKNLEAEIMESVGSMHLLPGNNWEDETRILEAAIGNLNEAQRRCIELFYLEERSYKEVSDTTGYSLNEVKSHLQNGKRNMRNFLVNSREL